MRRREHDARLSTHLVFLEGGNSLPNQVNFCSVLDRPSHFLPSMFGRWKQDRDVERQMRAAHSPNFADWHNVEMFAATLSGPVPPHASVPEWCSGYECHSEFNVPSSPVLAYFFYNIIAEKEIRETIWGISVREFCVFALASFLACARDYPCSQGATDTRIRS